VGFKSARTSFLAHLESIKTIALDFDLLSLQLVYKSQSGTAARSMALEPNHEASLDDRNLARRLQRARGKLFRWIRLL
jgi:hypothetical protein